MLGQLALMLAWEGLAGVIVYPLSKNILKSHNIILSDYYVLNFILVILAIPYVVSLAFFYNDFYFGLVTFTLISVTSLYRVILVQMRVFDINLYNIAKIYSSVYIFVAFIVVTNINIYLIFISPALGLALVYKYLRKMNFGRSQEHYLRNVFNYQFLILSLQALLTVLSTNGFRILLSSLISTASLGIFTKNYMIASGVFFIFSAIMVVYEPLLSKSTNFEKNDRKMSLLYQLSFYKLLITIFYLSFLYCIFQLLKKNNLDIWLQDLDNVIILFLVIYIFLTSVFSMASGVLISINQEKWVLFISAFGVSVLFVSVFLLQAVTLSRMVFLMSFSQLLMVLIAFVRLKLK